MRVFSIVVSVSSMFLIDFAYADIQLAGSSSSLVEAVPICVSVECSLPVPLTAML